MSTAISQPFRAPSEPFGQTGVRQYLGSFCTLVCAVGVAVCLSMWARSYNAFDMLDLFHDDSRTHIRSGNGRFFVGMVSGGAEQSVTWSYNTRPIFRRGQDTWPPSMWKTLGIEMRFVSGDARGLYWWLRVRWPTAAVLLAIWPAYHVWRNMHRAPRAAPAGRGFEVVARFCGRCGRPIHAGAARCGHCGRSLL